MRSNGFGLITPLLVLMIVAFDAPIVYMLGLAFWEKGQGLTLEHYAELFEAPVYLRVLGNTMRIAVIATLANVILGYPLAHWMRGLQNRARLAAIALVVLPNLAPSVFAAWIFAFIGSFDEVIVTSFIAGRYQTVPKKMFNELILEVNPTITAVATLLIGLTVLALVAVTFILARAGKLKQTIV